MHCLNQLYEKAEREYNAFISNWDWFTSPKKNNPHQNPWAEVWARIDQN